VDARQVYRARSSPLAKGRRRHLQSPKGAWRELFHSKAQLSGENIAFFTAKVQRILQELVREEKGRKGSTL